VDDNPLTEPIGTAGSNFRARELYHFTQAGFDRTEDPSIRYLNPWNPQLSNLFAPMNRSELRICQRAQFHGEFLHTFQNTFAHRDHQNTPFGDNAGHLEAGHDPDQTYNVQNSLALAPTLSDRLNPDPRRQVLRDFSDYIRNEDRTLAMEEAVFNRILLDWGGNAIAGFTDIRNTLVEFNLAGRAEYEAYLRTHSISETTAEYNARKAREIELKISILDQRLRQLELGGFDDTYSDADGNFFTARYDLTAAAVNRQDYLGNLMHGTPDLFPGILLPETNR
jgi:hypothetical protein